MSAQNKDLKKRVVAWMKPQMIAKMDHQICLLELKNQTKFIEQAVEFYLGYLESRDATPFLSEAVLNAVEQTIQSSQNRVSNNLFRLSVELNMMMNLLASSMNVPDETMHGLRGRCVKEVKETRGKIYFHDAMKYQNAPRDEDDS